MKVKVTMQRIETMVKEARHMRERQGIIVHRPVTKMSLEIGWYSIRIDYQRNRDRTKQQKTTNKKLMRRNLRAVRIAAVLIRQIHLQQVEAS